MKQQVYSTHYMMCWWWRLRLLRVREHCVKRILPLQVDYGMHRNQGELDTHFHATPRPKRTMPRYALKSMKWNQPTPLLLLIGNQIFWKPLVQALCQPVTHKCANLNFFQWLLSLQIPRAIIHWSACVVPCEHGWSGESPDVNPCTSGRQRPREHWICESWHRRDGSMWNTRCTQSSAFLQRVSCRNKW